MMYVEVRFLKSRMKGYIEAGKLLQENDFTKGQVSAMTQALKWVIQEEDHVMKEIAEEERYIEKHERSENAL